MKKYFYNVISSISIFNRNISRTITVILISMFFFSCQKESKVESIFKCSNSTFYNLETIEDYKKIFTVEFPKNWKTNLYFDDNQTSIYGADTTKQLTETILLDVTVLDKFVVFDDDFKLNLERTQLSEKLITKKTFEETLQNEEIFGALAVGKKGKYKYQELNYYSRKDNQQFIHTKTRIYGDSLVDERLCKAINLIQKIKLK